MGVTFPMKVRSIAPLAVSCCNGRSRLGARWRPWPRRSGHFGTAVSAICTSAHGLGISWRDDDPAAGAVGLPGSQLRLSNSSYDVTRTDHLRRDSGRLLAAAQHDGPERSVN